jgi:hypothetical protein
VAVDVDASVVDLAVDDLEPLAALMDEMEPGVLDLGAQITDGDTSAARTGDVRARASR